MRVLVTGASGFIGYHLSKKLLDEGYEVHGIDSMNGYYSTKIKYDRLSLLEKYNNFSFSEIDTCNRDDLNVVFAIHKFDVVIHLAAQAGVRYSMEAPYKYAESNLMGFLNIIEVCRQHHCDKFIYASSSSVYGNRDDGPFSETSCTDEPESLYAATKRADELIAFTYARQFGIKSVGLRFFSVYGPWGRPDMAYFTFTQKILKGHSIPVFNKGEMARDFTYIDDIVTGIVQLLKRIDDMPDYKIYNLGNNHPIKIMEFINVLEDAIGKKAIVDFLPMQAGDVVYTCADITNAANDFGFKPITDIRAGLKEFVDWYKEYFGRS